MTRRPEQDSFQAELERKEQAKYAVLQGLMTTNGLVAPDSFTDSFTGALSGQLDTAMPVSQRINVRMFCKCCEALEIQYIATSVTGMLDHYVENHWRSVTRLVGSTGLSKTRYLCEQCDAPSLIHAAVIDMDMRLFCTPSCCDKFHRRVIEDYRTRRELDLDYVRRSLGMIEEGTGQGNLDARNERLRAQ